MVYAFGWASRSEDQGHDDYGPLNMDLSEAGKLMNYAEPEKVHWRSQKKDGVGINVLEEGYRLDPNTLPKEMVYECGDQPFPDILPWFVVSSRFKDFVERFEPGVHQFEPVEIRRDRKLGPEATYYWFIICQRLDSVDRDQTTYAWDAPKDDPEDGVWLSAVLKRDPLRMEDIPGAKVVYNEGQIGSHHIWFERHIPQGPRLCSNAFGEAAVAENFSALSVRKVESAAGYEG